MGRGLPGLGLWQSPQGTTGRWGPVYLGSGGPWVLSYARRQRWLPLRGPQRWGFFGTMGPLSAMGGTAGSAEGGPEVGCSLLLTAVCLAVCSCTHSPICSLNQSINLCCYTCSCVALTTIFIFCCCPCAFEEIKKDLFCC